MGTMTVDELISLQQRIKQQLKSELFESAEKLGSFLLCSTRLDNAFGVGEGSHSLSLSLYADALFGKKEYLRSLSYYKQAMQRCKVGPSADGILTPSSPYHSVSTPEETELKLKEARCHLALKEIPKVTKVYLFAIKK